MIGYPRLGHMGRLGNQLWQIAGTLAFAVGLGEDVTLPAWDYAPYFSIPDVVFSDQPCVDAGELGTHLGRAAPYLQDQSLVESVAGLLAQWLSPSSVSRSLLENWVPPGFLFGHNTAVHVRRSDFVGNDHYVQLGMYWYRAAMDLILSEHPDTTFLVFSDDPEFCQDHLSSDDTIILSEVAPEGWLGGRDADGHPLPHPSELQEFWAMVACDRHVIANSSFSWWAAWLSADPSPIAPAKWYGSAYSDLDESRLLPAHWTVLP